MTTLQPLSLVIARALGNKNPAHRDIVEAVIKQHSVVIAGTVPMGRGIAYLVTQETADELTPKLARVPEPVEETDTPTEVHLGALEAKCDRMELALDRVNKTLIELIKSNNLLADRQAKVLSSLGAN